MKQGVDGHRQAL